jgi:hypothetical protein
VSDLASFDLKTRGGEARLRALLEDLVDYYKGVYLQTVPPHPLALAVWFEKLPDRPEQNLLALFAGKLRDEISITPRQSLSWKTGVEGPPFLEIHSSSLEHFSEVLRTDQRAVSRYRDRAEVLYFDKNLLNDEVIRFFNIVTAPSGLIRGWYLEPEVYEKSRQGGLNLRSRMQGRHEIGIVKTEESPDYVHVKGLPHVEVNQRWLPLSPRALGTYTWYNDLQAGHPGYFLLEGGSLYQILKFEVRTAPEYPTRFQLLEKLPDDRYPEVYLRAVFPSQSTAA